MAPAVVGVYDIVFVHRGAGLGDLAHRLEVTLGGGWKAGLDHINLELGELSGDLELLGNGETGSWRLLTIAQRRIEDANRTRCDARSGGASHAFAPFSAAAMASSRSSEAWNWRAAFFMIIPPGLASLLCIWFALREYKVSLAPSNFLLDRQGRFLYRPQIHDRESARTFELEIEALLRRK